MVVSLPSHVGSLMETGFDDGRRIFIFSHIYILRSKYRINRLILLKSDKVHRKSHVVYLVILVDFFYDKDRST